MALALAGKSDDVGLELDVVPSLSATGQKDGLALARLGKVAVLKVGRPNYDICLADHIWERRFGYLSILGLSCTVLVTWESSLVLFLVGFQNGGPAGTIYGYILVWIGTISSFVVLAELVSMAPTSGGQYHWVAILAPRHLSALLSYISGWLTLAGWLASLGAACFLTGGLIQGLIILCQPDTYVPKNWHVTLIYWMVLMFCVFVNVATGWLLPKFEGTLLVLHIVGFFAVLIPLLILGPKSNAHEIFTTFYNLGSWNSQGLSFCIGIMGNVFSFVGGDAPIHLSEEIHNAQIVVPRSIMAAIAINGTLGFAMVLAVLFRLGDVDAILQENPAFPFMAIFYRAVQSRAGAAVMASIVMIMTISSDVGFSASTSRICWVFARDRGIPGWRHLSKLSPRTSIPVNAVAFTSVIAALLGLINISSTSAFNGIISVSIAGLFSSYLLTSTLLLYRRCTGGILPSSAALDHRLSQATGGSKTFAIWGPWKVPGALGVANNAFACAYLSFVFFFNFWPTYKAVQPDTMIWSVLVTGTIAGLSTLYYVVWARKTYHGPVVEVTL